MKSALSLDSSNYVRVGAASALGAVTLLWAGSVNAACFQAGTVLLVLSLIPLARGLGARSGAMIGLLLSVVWIAARLGVTRSLDLNAVLAEVNVIIVAALMTIGGLAGLLLHSVSHADEVHETAIEHVAQPPRQAGTGLSASEFGVIWQEVMVRHREWMAGWDQASYPWTSFDNHIREIVRLLAGVQRLRCYRVSETGEFFPLSNEHQTKAIETPSKDLLRNAVTTGRRYLAGSAAAGPLMQQLAQAGTLPVAWVVPIRDRNVTIGLMTAESLGHCTREGELQSVADFVEELWLHVHHVDLLRTARQTDRGSGLINRTDFLASLRATLDECYKLHEPVVLMVVCLEGLRGLDDASQWEKRDALVEAVGQTIAAGIRKDDMVGRFSDAQFVALLRRLDVPLAELICRKLLSSMAKVICDFELGKWITPRAGLAGSGFSKPDAEVLLRNAIAGLQQARTQDLLLVSQAAEKPKGASPA